MPECRFECVARWGRPLEAMALIGLGIEQFSITPAAIGPIKAMVRRSMPAASGAGSSKQL